MICIYVICGMFEHYRDNALLSLKLNALDNFKYIIEFVYICRSVFLNDYVDMEKGEGVFIIGQLLYILRNCYLHPTSLLRNFDQVRFE